MPAESYIARCASWFKKEFGKDDGVFLTSSCSQALLTIGLLYGWKKGDEVICSSFTFPGMLNGLVMLGVTPVFVDIHPSTMNMDENKVAEACTKNTKAVVAMHYGGVACAMNELGEICRSKNIRLIEDAAHGILASYENRPLGTIGDAGAISFDYQKNINCGQGGLLLLSDTSLSKKAAYVLQNGTNRNEFLQGKTPFYEWMELGLNGNLSEIQAKHLFSQLKTGKETTKKRVQTWHKYYCGLAELEGKGYLKRAKIPPSCSINGHIFYFLLNDNETRDSLNHYLNGLGVGSSFHYYPLHRSAFGKKIGKFFGPDQYTTNLSERLLRLPLSEDTGPEEADRTLELIYGFFKGI